MLFLIKANPVTAGNFIVAENSASLTRSYVKTEDDYRISTLRLFLADYNSPLTNKASVFIEQADKNSLDWRLVAAIAGVESTFGKRIPYNSYNAYGWSGGKYVFTSWEDSIAIVNETLRKNYVNRGAVTVDQIGRIYAPPSTTWSRNVKFFMDKIDPVPLAFSI